MQFTTLLFAAAAFIGSVSAQDSTAPAAATLNITNIDVSGLKAGVPFEVTWGSAKGPVTLTLQHGLDANNLETYEVLTSELTSSSISRSDYANLAVSYRSFPRWIIHFHS